MTNQRADGVREAFPLFQEEGSGAIPTSALDLCFGTIDTESAIRLNRLWHSRLPRFGRAPVKVCYGAEFEGIYYAVAIWSNPVARLLPQDWLELRRLAIAPDAPKNTASRMLGWMARDIRCRFPDTPRLVSYQDTEVHTGTIYRAAGWEATAIAEASYGDHHQWSNKSRARAKGQSDAAKQRWERGL